MTSLYHSKVRSTQNKGVTFLFGTWTFSIIFLCFGEAKVSTVNSDLSIQSIIWVVPVRDTRSNDARFMHKLYLSLHAIKRLAQERGGIQPTLH